MLDHPASVAGWISSHGEKDSSDDNLNHQPEAIKPREVLSELNHDDVAGKGDRLPLEQHALELPDDKKYHDTLRSNGMTHGSKKPVVMIANPG